MTEVSISVLTDPDPRHAGEAILRLTGVALVPPGSTYRIDPIDDDGPAEPPDGWPAGELKPSAQRITSDGVDLVIGSDVVEATALLPGTPVTISIPAVGARAELRWPSLPVAKPLRRTAVVVSGEQRAAELAARSAAERAAAARAELEREEAERGARVKADVEAAARQGTEEATRKAKSQDGLSSLSLSPESPAKQRAVSDPKEQEALATLQPVGDGHAVTAPVAAMPRPPRPAPPRPLAASTATVKPKPVPPGAVVAPALRPAAPVSAGSAPQAAASRSWGLATAAFVLGATLAGAAAWLLPSVVPRPAAPMSVAAPLSTPEPATTDRTGSFASPRLAEILTVPDTSPLGQAAGGITLDEALRRADQGLYGGDGANPDRREAKYWLRKALSIGLGDDRLLWAMTQLGTLYAAPDGEAPDYTAARTLWELAAAKGDPVALCFLASVFETGLGVAKDARRALALFEQAKGNGGCRGIDDALNRLRKVVP